jgi:hypothetical protein
MHLRLSPNIGIAEDLSPFDVIFLGYRSNPHRYFRLARVFAFSSMTEGFPNILTEALATGVPTLAVDAPWGAREVLGLPADPMNNAFPTSNPIRTDVGTVMPRMDRPEFAAIWKSALLDHLRNDRRSPELTKRQRHRLNQLDVAHAAKRWETALQELVPGKDVARVQQLDEDAEPKGVRLNAIRIANALGKPFGVDPFPRSFPNPETAGLASRAAAFDRIYRTNFWGSRESRSGLGSEAEFARAYRQRLQATLSDLGARRLFDAPCGDLNWIAELAREPEIDYLGGDISEALIADLKERFPDIPVRLFDVCSDPFPEADVWHCRDCLFHLPFADIRRAFENFAASTIPFALLTSHKARLHRNPDVTVGGFRYLDLEKPPISLPPAERYLKDYRLGRDFPRYVGLWRREAIAALTERGR